MSKALIVVDVQRDFCEGGKLTVQGGKETARTIKQFLNENPPDPKNTYQIVVATKDFHNPKSDNHGHISETPDYVTTWPAHCTSDTAGSHFQHPVKAMYFHDVFKKGRGVPAYSGFQGVGVYSKQTLDEYLRSNDIDEIDVCGIAFDYCVLETCLDGVRLGYRTNVLANMCASIAPKDQVVGKYRNGGVIVLDTKPSG